VLEGLQFTSSTASEARDKTWEYVGVLTAIIAPFIAAAGLWAYNTYIALQREREETPDLSLELEERKEALRGHRDFEAS